MKRFKNILAIYDGKIGDEAALDRAIALARANGARLTLAEPVENTPGDVMAVFGSLPGSAAEIERRFVEERFASLERLAASIRHDGIAASANILVGRPFLEVIRAVIRDEHDLVVMNAKSRRGLRHLPFGSTSMHLMRKCPCPVWVMQPKVGRRFRRIMAAIDPDVTEASPGALDVKIMQLASSLARMEACHLDVLHAWDLSGADLDTSQSEISDEIMSQLVARNKAAHQAAVRRLIETIDLQGVAIDVHLPKGDPVQMIPEFASDKQVDLIVMGTIGRSGISGFLIGDTAEMVLRQVGCSVLAVKPDGFVTPVMASD